MTFIRERLSGRTVTAERVRAIYAETFANEAFVRVPSKRLPEVAAVAGVALLVNLGPIALDARTLTTGVQDTEPWGVYRDGQLGAFTQPARLSGIATGCCGGSRLAVTVCCLGPVPSRVPSSVSKRGMSSGLVK